MASVTKGGTLADTNNSKNDVYALVDNATVTNIVNADISATAAIADSKISALSGASQGDILYHNGTSYTNLAAGTDGQFLKTQGSSANPTWANVTSVFKHYRKGFTIKAGTTADEQIKVTAGVIDVGGTMVTSTSDSSDIAIATDGNWKDGSAPDVTSSWIYVLIDNAGNIKLDENAPAYSYTDESTAEAPLRYHKQSTTYYRYLGAVYCDADGDLCLGGAGQEGLFVTNFDASNVCVINGLANGSDQTFVTMWSPKYVKIWLQAAGTTNATDAVHISDTTSAMLSILPIEHSGAAHQWNAATTNGMVKTITAQSAGTAGSFTMDGGTDNYVLYAVAYTDIL